MTDQPDRATGTDRSDESGQAAVDDPLSNTGNSNDATVDEGLDYETARDQLADVVRRLEAGGLSLEDSLALWERGEALATLCERHLAGARERVERALAAAEDEDADS